MIITDRFQPLLERVKHIKTQSFYPYFQPISRSFGPEVEVGDLRLVMIGSNDYLGLTHDAYVLDRAEAALRRWGTGSGGSRFLSGNMTLHEELEIRLAAFVGKKCALVHTTGFLANLGAISTLIAPDDIILYDKENHASIAEGCRSSAARITYFDHNNATEARRKLVNTRKKNLDTTIFLITEGVFSMSGDVSALPELVAFKEDYPELIIYLDDAHGLGVMGKGGRGTAMHFGCVDKVDYIMGTFSKAMASIGGFIATDNEDVLLCVKHNSKTLIFSAALPACNAATVLACLDILEREPERVERLWHNTEKVRAGYNDIGLITGTSASPIVPIYIGDDDLALAFSSELFKYKIFALPALYPAVPKGKALIRTAYMSTHEDRHIDYVLEVLAKMAKKYRIRQCDLES
ncbi:Pyridoxal phosphate-dependent aminotransferase family protein [Desulfovibrionales bacterium]